MILTGLFVQDNSDNSKNIYAPDKQLGTAIGENINTKSIDLYIYVAHHEQPCYYGEMNSLDGEMSITDTKDVVWWRNNVFAYASTMSKGPRALLWQFTLEKFAPIIQHKARVDKK